jgi:Predicted membrane protein
MNTWEALLIGAAGASAAVTLAWLIQLRTRDAGIVDAIWSWTLGGLALWFAASGDAPSDLRALLALMGGLWGLRLGLHLFLRNHGKPEDGRYARFRAEWGARANRNLFAFFQLQALFAMLLAVGFIALSRRATMPSDTAIVLAILIWLAAVGGEALADWQLAAFKRNPVNRRRVCRRGLWRYSRHPNYFFECLHWVAYVPLAWGDGWSWLTLLPPVVMAYLLLRLSGVPLTEAQAASSRPEYAAYIRTTSAFIPWPPRRDPQEDQA